MKELKKLISNIDKHEFKRYFIFSVLLIAVIIVITSYNIALGLYETDTDINVEPTLSFFVVGVESQTQSIKLDSIVPRTEPYLFVFNVSNFKNNRKANVDLTYSIEIITTTNMPLNYRIYKGAGSTVDEIDSDTFATDEDGMYYRHLAIDGISTFYYNTYSTDVYTLFVEFPIQYRNNADDYAGIIELVDIKIDASQVVS